MCNPSGLITISNSRPQRNSKVCTQTLRHLHAATPWQTCAGAAIAILTSIDMFPALSSCLDGLVKSELSIIGRAVLTLKRSWLSAVSVQIGGAASTGV